MPQPESPSPPGTGRPRPGRGEAAIPTSTKIEASIGETADINHGCHCGPLGLDGIRAAASLGIYCAPGHCAYDEMRVAS
jgi:hypothetical protein